MEKIVISICIPVYNQIEIVKKCIAEILKSKSAKFEIVINDDCSNEPIMEMVDKFKDERVKYYRNRQNVGHDQNILASFSNAKADYVFLLRSRDFLLPDGLEKIIELLEKNSEIAYLTTSAYDSNMVPKLVYRNHVFNKGYEALLAHQQLYVHPSGSVYNISKLDIYQISEYLTSIKASKRNFTVHSLMRTALSMRGKFVTCDFFSWIYSDTNEAIDIATNRGEKKESVYDIQYQLERYDSEMNWVNIVVPEELKDEEYAFLFSFYLYASTWNNKLIYKNRKMAYHYNFEMKRIDCKKVRREFLQKAAYLEKKLDIRSEQYYRSRKKILLKNISIDAIKYYIEIVKMVIPFKEKIKKVIYGKKMNLRRVM